MFVNKTPGVISIFGKSVISYIASSNMKRMHVDFYGGFLADTSSSAGLDGKSSNLCTFRVASLLGERNGTPRP